VPSLPNFYIATWLLSASSLGAVLIAGIPAYAGPLPERVERAAQERIAAGTYQTLVFGVVDGDRSDVVAFGRLDDGKAPDGETVYEIGSITKTFTATLLARAVLAGRVTLDTPVAQLLPGWKIPSRSGQEITLGTLATHHSGLPRLPTNLQPKDPSDPYADYDAAKLKAFLDGYELPRDPGASYEYSNLGFGLLGHALAQMDHTSYDALADEVIFKPLGMTMTSTGLTDAARAHLAPGHDDKAKAAKNWNFDALAGAGAIYSTANDLLRYLKANMDAASSPLSAAMKLAQQPRGVISGKERIGLAWMTSSKGIVQHGGATYGYRSFAGFTADGRWGIVVLTNTAEDIDDLGFATLDDSAPLAPVHKAVSLPAASLAEYEGTYRLADKFLLTVFRTDDGLSAQATGQSAFPLFPSAPGEFFAKTSGISISFTRNPDGAVSGLVLHQNGDHAAPKLKPSDLAAASLDEYAGTYRLADKFLLKIFPAENGLFAEATGQGAFPIFPSLPNEFYAKTSGIGITFKRDGKGAVTGLVLHQGGNTAAPKLSDSDLPPELREVTLDSATLGDYAGRYKFDFGAVIEVTARDRHLDAQLTGQPAFPVFANARDRFFYMAVEAQLEFERDAGGKVVAAILHQNGRHMRAPRLAQR
jgi:serine-type D-Ala-D-Ala carboxypeptidase/endopeptidase